MKSSFNFILAAIALSSISIIAHPVADMDPSLVAGQTQAADAVFGVTANLKAVNESSPTVSDNSKPIAAGKKAKTPKTPKAPKPPKNEPNAPPKGSGPGFGPAAKVRWYIEYATSLIQKKASKESIQEAIKHAEEWYAKVKAPVHQKALIIEIEKVKVAVKSNGNVQPTPNDGKPPKGSGPGFGPAAKVNWYIDQAKTLIKKKASKKSIKAAIKNAEDWYEKVNSPVQKKSLKKEIEAIKTAFATSGDGKPMMMDMNVSDIEEDESDDDTDNDEDSE